MKGARGFYPKLIFGLASLFLVISLSSLPVCAEEDVSGIVQELKALKARIQYLEKRLEDQDKKMAEQQRALDEQKKQFVHIDKHILHMKELEPKIVKKVEVGVGTTTIVQGGTNIPLQNGDKKDKVDANISVDIELAAKIGDHGQGFLALEAIGGNGLTDEVDAFTGVNDDAGDNGEKFQIREAWYEHAFLGDKVLIAGGKLDPTNYFDTNAVANDERSQFLAFVNSHVIEFPDRGLGMRLLFSPSEFLDFGLGFQDADSDWEDVFDNGFGIAEMSVNPTVGELAGHYRPYVWINALNHPTWEEEALGLEGDDTGWGFGLNLDQEIVRELLTCFARIGYQDKNIYPIDLEWSAGFQLLGKPWCRGNDVLGLAYAMAHVSDDYRDFSTEELANYETHWELYYSICLWPDQVYLSPDFQIITHAAGREDADTMCIGGMRLQTYY